MKASKDESLVVVLSPTGTIEEISESAASVLGYEPQRLTGSLLFRHIYDADMLYIFRRISDLILGRKTDTKVRFHIRSAEGNWLPIKGTARVLIEGGAVAQIIMTLYPVVQALVS